VDGVKIPQVEGANDPSDPFPTPTKLFTIDQDLGGWAVAAKKFFNDGEDGNPVGIVPQLQEETGKQGEE
jgi:sulfate transport system substrate-binding protein